MSAFEHLSPDQFRNQANPNAVRDMRLYNGRYLLHDTGNGFIAAHRVIPQRMVAPGYPDASTCRIRNDYWDKDTGQRLPAPGRAGELSLYTGPTRRNASGIPLDQLPVGDPEYSGVNGGTIGAVRVPRAHQRKGVASAMLGFAREQYGDVRHSQVLQPDGAAWAKARP